jgi:hypothetical protein
VTKPVNVVVPAELVRPILVHELEALEARGEHALSALGRRVSQISGEQVDSTCKRIRFILRGWRPILRAADADALVLACGRFLELEGLPHLPGSKSAARTMVLAHEAATNERLSNRDRNGLAEALWSFTSGFISAFTDAHLLTEAA